MGVRVLYPQGVRFRNGVSGGGSGSGEGVRGPGLVLSKGGLS